MDQRRLGQRLDPFGQILVGPVDAIGLIEGFALVVLGRVIAEARGMAQQIEDGNRVLRRHQAGAGLAGGRIGLGHGDLHLGEFGEICGDRVAQVEFALFIELHCRHSDDRLGHRREAEDGVLGHRLGRRLVHQPEIFEIGELAPPRDQHHGTGQPVLADALLDQCLEAVEPLLGQADTLRRCCGQILRPARGSGQERQHKCRGGETGEWFHEWVLKWGGGPMRAAAGRYPIRRTYNLPSRPRSAGGRRCRP